MLQGSDPSSHADLEKKLPYMEMVLKESARMHPALALSLPEKTVKQVTDLGGYQIPKGVSSMACWTLFLIAKRFPYCFSEHQNDQALVSWGTEVDVTGVKKYREPSHDTGTSWETIVDKGSRLNWGDIFKSWITFRFLLTDPSLRGYAFIELLWTLLGKSRQIWPRKVCKWHQASTWIIFPLRNGSPEVPGLPLRHGDQPYGCRLSFAKIFTGTRPTKWPDTSEGNRIVLFYTIPKSENYFHEQKWEANTSPAFFLRPYAWELKEKSSGQGC